MDTDDRPYGTCDAEFEVHERSVGCCSSFQFLREHHGCSRWKDWTTKLGRGESKIDKMGKETD